MQTSAKFTLAILTLAASPVLAFGIDPAAPSVPSEIRYFCSDAGLERAFVGAIAKWNAALDGRFTVVAVPAEAANYGILRSPVNDTPLGGSTSFGAAGTVITIYSSPPGLFALDAVMLHETGHMLGLVHSVYPDSIMYATLDIYRKPELAYDDVAGIRTLYGLSVPTFNVLQVVIDRSDRRWKGRHGRFRFLLSGLLGAPARTNPLTGIPGTGTARWDFGDSTHGIGESVTHRYKAHGTYHVTVSSLMFTGELDMVVK